METPYQKKFKDTLAEIFEMDHAELDFGIYRIMNQKRSDIEEFLNRRLIPMVTQTLRDNLGDETEKLKEELEKLRHTLTAAGIDPGTSPKVKELEERIASGADVTALENEVFNHLTRFFSRYYEGGDFISKRRYKDDTYAIPYSGEEVKLYWANADQYYIKTSEYFKNYTFALPSGKKVHFALRDAQTEQNNNKAANNMERRFQLCTDDCVSIENGELSIFFTYELMPKATKQDKLLADAETTLLAPGVLPEDCDELRTMVKAGKDKQCTLLMKCLKDYTAKNSFDYFIHKDLGGFLRRELDFYIKNEVMQLDDLDAQHILQHLAQVKAIKSVGERIIRFLAQLEDFQKRLWLKKKFVVESNYCITLDRIPSSFYAEIAANTRQREEWVRLFAIDDIHADLATEGYSEPLTEEFLRQNPCLVLDTQFFSDDFKHRLLASFDNIDEECNGLLINSENFQALSLLQEKYAQAVKCTFIDPPYNTEDSEGENDFNYKDCYQHASWLSLMSDRMKLSFSLLNQKGLQFTTISDFELSDLLACYDAIFTEDNRIGTVEWNSTKSVTNTALISMGHTHIPIYAKDKNYYVKNRIEFRLPDSEDGFSNPDNDPRGKWKADPFQVGGVRPNQLYDIVNPNTGVVYRPNPGNSWKNEYKVFKKLVEDNRIVFGATGEAGPQRKRFWFEAEERGKVPKTWWDDVETTTNGTSLLKNLFSQCPFKNPKPVGLLERIGNLGLGNDDIMLDYFAGSGTTGHAVINLNREDNGNRKYILCEMGYYFDSITKPRVQKTIYSEDWRDGKPVSRKGVSQMFKYVRLEQYEDTLNNLIVRQQQQTLPNGEAEESYLLGYWLDTETKGSLFNIEWFRHPFDMKLKTTRDCELIDTPVDMVDTFNYLIGLRVETLRHPKEGLCVVEGVTHREGERTLVIWRDMDKVSSEQLNDFFRRSDYNTRDTEFDRIYVNGDNLLPNIRTDEEHWKVVLTEEEFKKRMFTD